MESGGTGASFFMKPGMRKVAGETLREACTPLQPEPQAMSASKTAARMHFQFSFTSATIEAVNFMAIKNSGRAGCIRSSTICVAFCCALFCLAWSVAGAETNTFAARRELDFKTAQSRLQEKPDSVAALVRVAQTAFEWAEFARQDEPRASLAERGLEVARAALARAPTNGAAHYWLAMNSGQLARTKILGALKLVREMEEEFLRAIAFDEQTDFAGPDRYLGVLYRDAPGWPTSIGNKIKSREHLERAVSLRPDYPENQLLLLESLEKWGDKRGFEQQLPVTEKVLAEARLKFTGADWEQSWKDWDHRFPLLKARSGESSKPLPGKDGK